MLPIEKGRLDMPAGKGTSLGTRRLITVSLVEATWSAEGPREVSYKGFTQKWDADASPLSLSDPPEESWESCFTPDWWCHVSWQGAFMPSAQ